jgi:rhodanese-related sulfurtransferase
MLAFVTALAGLACAAEAPKKQIPPARFYEEAARIPHRTAKARDLAKWLKEGAAVLLDVRSAKAYERRRIAGALNLPASELTPEDASKVIPSTSTRVVLYCDASLAPVRMIAATTLAYPALWKLGYTNLYTLEEVWTSKDCKGGREWFGAGCPRLLPMEGTEVPAKKPAP